MTKFKVGDKLVPKDGNKCINYHDCNGAYIIITAALDKYGYRYDIYDKQNNLSGYCSTCFKDDNLDYREHDMNNLQAGDVLEHDNRDYNLKVQGTIGEVVFAIDFDHGIVRYYSVRELKDKGWKLKTDEPETTELTLEQVAEKFDIPVDKLRIKD
jgi:hypothetical protein